MLRRLVSLLIAFPLGLLLVAIAIAALYRCLVHALTLDPTICDTWEDHYYLVNLENRWQAIRYGLDATVLDPVTGKVQPMRRCVREMVARLAPGAKALGCNAELRDVLRILEIGTSAERQTVMHEVAVDRGAGPLEAMRLVAAGIANETLAAALALWRGEALADFAFDDKLSVTPASANNAVARSTSRSTCGTSSLYPSKPRLGMSLPSVPLPKVITSIICSRSIASLHASITRGSSNGFCCLLNTKHRIVELRASPTTTSMPSSPSSDAAVVASMPLA